MEATVIAGILSIVCFVSGGILLYKKEKYGWAILFWGLMFVFLSVYNIYFVKYG